MREHVLNRITVNREREFHIDWPEGEWREPDLEAAGRGILCLPGVVAVEMLPPRERFGGIEIPETAQKRLRAHFGTVLSANGCPWLEVGDRVCVRAYRGLHFEPLACDAEPDHALPELGMNFRLQPGYAAIFPEDRKALPLGLVRACERLSHVGVVAAAGAGMECAPGDRVVFSRYHHKLRAGGLNNEEYTRLDAVGPCVIQHRSMIYARLRPSGYVGEYVRFLGGLYPLSESILMVDRGDENGTDWRPVPGWVWIERDLADEVDGVVLSERAARNYRQRARIVKTATPSDHEGQECLVAADPNAAIWFGMRAENARYQLIRERDLLGILEES